MNKFKNVTEQLEEFKEMYGEEYVETFDDYDKYALNFVPQGTEYVRYFLNEGESLPRSLEVKDDYGVYLALTSFGIRTNLLIDMQRSGLANIQEIRGYTFDNYIVTEKWQEALKEKAVKYVDEFDGEKWFFVSGETGMGKSHLCTSIVFGLASKGIGARYVSYPDVLDKMRSNIEQAGDMLNELKKAEVLYIDDFLKTMGNKGNLTEFEGRQVISLMWHRYNNALPTIVSTELSQDEIAQIDKSLRGRMIEMSGEFVFQAHGRDKDYRIKKAKGE